MRKPVVVFALLLLATAAHAQKAGTVEVSAFVTDPSMSWTKTTGSTYHASYGASANVFFSPRWSGALSVTSDTRTFVTFTQTDFVARRFRVFPVDALVQYHFTHDSRWRPYVGAGLNYLNRPMGLRAWTAAEANGGVTFAITPRLGINADVKVLLTPAHVNEGPSNRTSLGLTWRF
jgi:outer membrane protein W